MALPFLYSGPQKRPTQILAVDLGARFTKAVQLQRRGDDLVLSHFAIIDAPIFDKALSAEMLADHLKAVSKEFESKSKLLALTIGVNDAIVRHVEMPAMPDDDIRLVLKHNSRVYLQQDLSGYIFDFFKSSPPSSIEGKPASAQKQKVLIAGAKSQLIDDYLAATKAAGFVPNHIVPCVIGPVNAFEKAQPETFSQDVVALVDIGFKSSSISVIKEGELMLNRVVNIGGDRLTTGLSEAMSISYAEAEGIKIGMATEVQSFLEPLIMPLGRELRASIDFFEHQQDRSVSKVFVSGGSAKSEFVQEMLRQELMVDCLLWDPTASLLKQGLGATQSSELEQVAPQLTVAVGTALTVL
jgi:type IV pilus assembly protein PilM